MKIGIFYHCLLYHGTPPDLLMNAVDIVTEQMTQIECSGLLDACDEMVVGCNGGDESFDVARLIIPMKARLLLHGLHSKAENLTIVHLWEWAKSHPGWAVLYFHSKGATHAAGSSYGETVSKPWRRGMMQDLVLNWRQCVSWLAGGNDIVCSHWMWNMGSDRSQHIPAGNFLWVKSDFISKLPSIHLRERIKVSGISNAESRFEAEVFWGNGPRPIVIQFRPHGGNGIP